MTTPTPATGAAAELPVVAYRFQADANEDHWMHCGPDRIAGIKVIGSMGGVVTASEALTPQAPAQSQLDALREEVARLKESQAVDARNYLECDAERERLAAAIKAQPTDIDALMALAEKFADSVGSDSRDGACESDETIAAREALRTALAARKGEREPMTPDEIHDRITELKDLLP